MDYSRMGGVKPGRNQPRFTEGKSGHATGKKGAAQKPDPKAALLARMKKAAEQGKT